jgi:tRNA threonylcarbamoyl adenosine modification protein YeaZ
VLVLALDTSSAAVTAAVADVGADSDERNPAGFWQRVTVNAKAHGELLTPSIAACLDEAGARPADLGAVVAGLGPGPFTGLRVGLVTASALADALGVPSYGVCSLDAIRRHYEDGDGWSLDGPGTDDRGPELVLTDARRREVYWAAYRGWRRVDGPAVCRPDDLPHGRWATGAGATLYADVLRGKGIPVFDREYPSPFALITLALDRIRARAPSETLVPMYLRRPDAVPPGAPKPVSQP